MATPRKAAAKRVATARKAPARAPVRTAAKKPYKDNTGDNTQPPKAKPKDAIDLLVADHLAAAKCFKRYETMMKKRAPDAERAALANKVCDMLEVHTQIEEEIFYPAARAVGIDVDVMDEAYVEHAGAKELIAQIQSSNPMGEYYDAKVKVLGDIVNHHVVEEHTDMFPKCRRSTMNLVDLRAQMESRKGELEGKTPKGEETSSLKRVAGGLKGR